MFVISGSLDVGLHDLLVLVISGAGDLVTCVGKIIPGESDDLRHRFIKIDLGDTCDLPNFVCGVALEVCRTAPSGALAVSHDLVKGFTSTLPGGSHGV